MIDEQILVKLKKELSVAIDIISKGYTGNSLTDIYILLDSDSGEISVYDDEHKLFYQFIISDWCENTDEDEVLRYLRKANQDLDLAGQFDNLDIYKPFSVNFADEDFYVIEELLTIEDDSIVRLDNEFLKRIDKEFDDFLDKLLKE